MLESIELFESEGGSMARQELYVQAMDGTRPEYAIVGQPLILSTSTRSSTWEEKPFIQIVEVRSSRDIAVYIGWFSGTAKSWDELQSNITIGISWIPIAADDYQIRSFLIDAFEDPEVLSYVVTSRIEVLDLQNSIVTFIERAPNTTFEKADYTLQEAQELLREIGYKKECDLYSYNETSDPERYEWLMPQVVNFEYIEPSMEVFRIGCVSGVSGLNYAYVSYNNGTLVNAESMFTIDTPYQAVEYLQVFPRSHVGLLYTVQDLNIEYRTQLDVSPIKRAHVIDDGSGVLVVKLHVIDIHDGQLEYEKWDIPQDRDASGHYVRSPSVEINLAELGYMA
jgi:hypothetical protein